MYRPEGGQEPPVPVRKDRWAAFRGLAWWEIMLSLLPVTLVGVGGLIGGLFGAVGLMINLNLAKRRLGVGLEVMAMLGVSVAAFVLYFVVAGTILAHIR
jgi:hypothetical protein